MRHQPGVEHARLAAGEPEQQVEFAFGKGLRPVDTLIADDEVALIGVGTGKAPFAARASRKVSTRAWARFQVAGPLCSSSTQRVPCSMLAATNRARRRAERYCQSQTPPPAPRAGGLPPARQPPRPDGRALPA